MKLYRFNNINGICRRFIFTQAARCCPTREFKAISKKIYLDKLKDVTAIDTAQTPLCIIMGWGNSTQKQLAKYSEIYKRKGFHTITVSPLLIDALVLPQTRGKKISYQILDAVYKEFAAREVPVIFHHFSNAGCALYYFICEELTTDGSKYAEKIKVIGSIFDSCPVVPTFDSIKIAQNAFTMEMKNPILKSVVWYSLRLLLPFVIWLNPIVKLFMTGLQNSKIQAPQMFLYSKSDMLAPYEDISMFLKVREKNGIDVTSKLWEDSFHVRHLVHDPEGYVRMIDEFVAKIHIKEN